MARIRLVDEGQILEFRRNLIAKPIVAGVILGTPTEEPNALVWDEVRIGTDGVIEYNHEQGKWEFHRDN